jgi:hypothetical protein
MIPADTAIEWPKIEIWGWASGFFMLLIYFYVFKSLEGIFF